MSNGRDCAHGRQIGKCDACDIETLEVENRMLRERNERLEAEHAVMKAELTTQFDANSMLLEERDTAIKAYRGLLLKYDRMEARMQR